MPIFTGLLIGGGLAGAGSLASGLIGSSAATTASGQQTQAEEQATQLQGSIFNQIMANYSPFLSMGADAAGVLYGPNGLLSPQMGLSGPLASEVAGVAGQPIPTSPGLPAPPPTPQVNPMASVGAPGPFSFAPTLSQLTQFPGYQFALQQGEENVASQFGGSQPGGAEIKAQTSFAEGLAGQTEGAAYQQAAGGFGLNLQNYIQQLQQSIAAQTASGHLALGAGSLGLQTGQANFSDILAAIGQRYSQGVGGATTLAGLFGGGVSTGLTAAGGGAGTASTLGPAIAGTIGGVGAAQAAGTVGSANAITGGLTGVGQAGSNTALYLALANAGLFGAPGGGASGAAPAAGMYNFGPFQV